METFSSLGVVRREDWGDVGAQGGRPQAAIDLKPEFSWLLEDGFKALFNTGTAGKSGFVHEIKGGHVYQDDKCCICGCERTPENVN